MDGLVERELKLQPPCTFWLARLPPRLDHYVLSPVRFIRLHTLYYDTADLRLTRWGCSLRLRRGEGWTLKIPVPTESDALFREEHVFAGDDTAVPAGVLDLSTAYVRGAAVEPVAELRTLRTSRHILSEAGDDVAEVVEDDVRVVDGTRVVRRFRQIEIELADGVPDDCLEELEALLRGEGAGKPDRVPKNVRALGDRAREPEIEPLALGARSCTGDVARAALAASVERIVRDDAPSRLGPDEEVVHHARVAVRRLRSDLRTFLPLFDESWACALRDRLSWLQDGLSAARDADVLIAGLRRRSQSLAGADSSDLDELLHPFCEERDAAYERVRATLRDERYVPLLQDLVDAANRPPLTAAAAERARDAIPALFDDAWSTLRKRVRKRTRPPSDRELHRIRIAAKRMRYAAEAVLPVAGRPARALARAAERMQTILGDEHDAVVAYRRLRDLAHGEHAFLAGQLAALEIAAQRDARATWRDAWRAAKRAHRRFRR
jgi:CHAD domain-containing protein